MKIRKANENDLIQTSTIFRTELQKEPYNRDISDEESFNIIEHYFKNQVMLISEIDNQVVGFVTGHKFFWIGGWRLWVGELFVAENYQRKGIGKKLMQEFKSQFKEVKYVEFVAHKDAASIKFYKKLGYKETGYVKFEKEI